MNATRPIDGSIFAFSVAWMLIALGVATCLIFMATRGQSPIGKLLYAIGGVLLLTLPAALAFKFAVISWYGGTPDHTASVDGRFYVREKVRLTPVSKQEFLWVDRVHRADNWFVWPCVVGAVCIGLGHLARPTARSPGDSASA
jgi:hypothetical protein